MARQTDTASFQLMWEEYIENMSHQEISKWLSETSSQHTNENMRWLYDRFLLELVTNNSNPTE